MNLFELFVKIGVDDQASGKLKDLGSKLGNGLKTAAKIGTAAVSAAAAGITALTTAAVNNYAEYEQLVGGVETLFKGSAAKVQEYAANAYKTAGLSANEYMSTVTSFSASLLQSLGGDTEEAAEYANQALTDMSDNANKMGTDMSLIQNAYQGFAKANYTMLDNLKLGYGGTAQEMYRLLTDAAALNEEFANTANFSIDSKGHLEAGFADIVKAINIVQTEMGITGTTALEASTTISGSVASMKAAWADFTTALADENADYQWQLDNLLESVKVVAGNVLPVVEQVLWSITDMVQDVFPEIVSTIPEIISEGLPRITEVAVELVQSLVDGILQNQEMLMTTAIDTLAFLNASFLSMLPQLVEVGLEMLVSLIKGVTDNMPMLIETAVDVVLQLVETLTDPKQISELLDAAFELLTEFAYGLMDAIPELVDAALTIIESLVNFVLSPQNTAKILQAALEIVLAIGTGLVNSIPRLLQSAVSLISSFTQTFRKADWAQIGSNIVSGIWDGLRRMWGSLTEWFSNAWENLVGGVKDLLGIHSPSRVFASIGANMALGVGKGWEDEIGAISDDIDRSLSFGEGSIGIGAYGTAGEVGYGSTSIGNITINVNGAKYNDEQSLASAIAFEIQNMTDRRAAVYA